MKRLGILLIVACGLGMGFFASGCDFVDPPYSDVIGDCPLDDDCLGKLPVDPFSEAPVKKVLFEEYTGHKCVNCPRASEIAYDLAKNTFKDRAYLVSVHATGLAEADPAPSKYSTDYTTEAGNEYKDIFNIIAVPLGLINRELRPNSTEFYFSSTEWEATIAETLDQPAEAQIHITPCYNDSTRELKIVSDIKYLTDATDREHYTVWLVEDSVRGWQKDGRRQPQDVENYLFHDLFRGALNGPFGQPLTDGVAVSNGDTFREGLCYTMPDEFVAEHCKILVFVQDFETKRIRQVEEVALIE